MSARAGLQDVVLGSTVLIGSDANIEVDGIGKWCLPGLRPGRTLRVSRDTTLRPIQGVEHMIAH